jgi:hypothetical protein
MVTNKCYDEYLGWRRRALQVSSGLMKMQVRGYLAMKICRSRGRNGPWWADSAASFYDTLIWRLPLDAGLGKEDLAGRLECSNSCSRDGPFDPPSRPAVHSCRCTTAQLDACAPAPWYGGLARPRRGLSGSMPLGHTLTPTGEGPRLAWQSLARRSLTTFERYAWSSSSSRRTAARLFIEPRVLGW